MRFSVPFSIRRMLPAWRIQISAPSRTAKATNWGIPSSTNHTGISAAAAKADSEEMRKISANTSHVAQAASPPRKVSASKVPR